MSDGCFLPTDDPEANGQSVDLCRDILESDPTNFDALQMLGANLFVLYRFSEAQVVYGQMVRARPAMFTAHFNLGLVLEYQEKFAESQTAFENSLRTAIEVHEMQTSAWHLGAAAYNLDDAAGALRWYRAAAAMDTTDATAWGLAGVSAEMLGSYREAAGYWARALEAEPRYFEYVSSAEHKIYLEVIESVGEQQPAPVTGRDHIFTVRERD